MRGLHRRMRRRLGLLASALLLALALAATGLVSGEGSGTLYRGTDPSQFRSHLEWRTSSYGGGDSPQFILRRRTLLKVFAQAGETILVASSGVGVAGPPSSGDIRIFNPGQVTGPIGQETLPALAPGVGLPGGAFANGFSCVAERTAAGDGRGRIANRSQEEIGPLPGSGGYTPCSYVAPATGIYDVVFTGPSGPSSNDEPDVSGTLDSPAADYGPLQRTSVTAWDVTVRDAGSVVRPGRLFSYYYAGNTGGNGRPLTGESYVVTGSGFRYRVFFGGDPYGFLFFVNRRGFQNSDGTPLYRNLLADAAADTQNQNQLTELQGGVRLLPPEYPIFVSRPDPLALDALGIPRQPVAPRVDGFAFTGSSGGASSDVGAGGSFSFTTTQAGGFYVVVSRDRVNFDPTDQRNRVLRGEAAAPGPVTVAWDGLDNSGAPFPPGDFVAATAVQGGEVHFPFLDVENNRAGGPLIELENAPDVTGDSVADCPPWSGGCFGAFYDDRGYRTAGGTLVGTAVNGNLCPGDASNPRGFGNPPLVAASDPVRGYDTRLPQRAFGFTSGGNPSAICLPTGGFGDKKALDLWTFYPSEVALAPLRIVDPTAVTLLRLSAARAGASVAVRWETGAELGTAGFHILRSATGRLEDAERVTPALIPARGGPGGGAAYAWDDAGAPAPGDYAYWLEEVEAGGTTHRHGPVRPAPAASAGPQRIWLPMLTQ